MSNLPLCVALAAGLCGGPAALAQRAVYHEVVGTAMVPDGPGGALRPHDVVQVWQSQDASQSATQTPEMLRLIALEQQLAAASPDVVQIRSGGDFSTRGGFGITYNVNPANAPVGYASALADAAAYLQTIFQDSIGITIDVSFSTSGFGPPSFFSTSYVTAVGYPASRSALIADRDADDFIQSYLPDDGALSFRDNATTVFIAGQTDIDWPRAAYNAVVGTSTGSSGAITIYMNGFTWDTDASNGIASGSHSLTDYIIHHTAAIMGMTSRAELFPNIGITPQDFFRFAGVDRAGLGNTNPTTLQEFITVPREIDGGDASQNEVCTIITSQYRMNATGNGTPGLLWQTGTTPSTSLGLLQPAIGPDVTYSPNFLREADLVLLDAVGWDILGFGMASASRQSKLDWNGDGWPDILFDRLGSGPGPFGLASIHPSGYQYRSWDLRPIGPTGWFRQRVSGDFNIDGVPDMLWRNDILGHLVYWFMDPANNNNVQSWGYLPSPPSVTTDFSAAGDMDGDGAADLIVRELTTGRNSIWYVDATGYRSQATIPRQTDLDWRIVGAADFDRDGHTDILWHNAVTGGVYLWRMNNATWLGDVRLASAPAGWFVKGVGDWNGDAKPDIFWWNATTGATAFWFMNGLTYDSWLPGPYVDPSSWN